MNNKALFKQLFAGSKAQRTRYKKEGLTTALQKKILEGNANSLRTFKVRLFILRFQNKELYNELKEVKTLMQEFSDAIKTGNQKRIKSVIKQYETKKKALQKMKNQSLQEASYIMQVILILTLTISLFKEVKIEYNKEIFSKENRYSPLNVYFPFKL